MARSPKRKVFISYSRKDGAELAQRLKKDLEDRAYQAWLDTREIMGGDSWTREIEDTLDQADVVLAVLTPGSYVSEICRAEQLRSLRKGKCVIPIRGHRDTEIPLHLEGKNYLDFSNSRMYSAQLAKLLKDIGTGKGATLREKYRQTYVTAPPLPVNFVERPEELAALRDAMLTDGPGRHVALTALRGMGGLGKTVLAQALCHDEVVQEAFPDGVIWVNVGKESTVDAVTRLREVGKALDDDLSRYDTEVGCKNQYRSTIRSKAALMVVDDVWNAADLEPLLAESPRSRLLFTTRDDSIAAAVGARRHIAELLTDRQGLSVLARWAEVEEEKLAPEASEILRQCGGLPLALAMTGAMLRGKPASMWAAILDTFRRGDIEQIKMKSANPLHSNLFRVLHASVEYLEARLRDRYLGLAVMLEDMAVEPEVQQTLWGVNRAEASRTADEFFNLSLAQPEGDAGALRLHDLQLDYVRAQYPDQKALEVIHEGLRLASHVIRKDPAQFASQMVGRLMGLEQEKDINHFITEIKASAPRPWIEPRWATLDIPGGSLRRTLEGHAGWVYGVAVSGDGRRAVSASLDHTLKVWDLDSGRQVRTLEGHSGWVYGVAVSGDGRRAVSASADKTLKVWDLESGRQVRTLEGHSGGVWGVAVSGDGRRAVSASDDKTLKVWDLDSGQPVRMLEGHSGGVRGVAVSGDGRRAVSASDDKTLKMWDLGSGQPVRTLEGHADGVNGVAVSGDGRRAVSASSDLTLKVWDLDSGQPVRTLEGHSGGVLGVAVSGDGRRAVSASEDLTLKVWDLDSGQPVRTLEGHSDWVRGVAVSGDGRRAVSVSDDKTLKVWELDSGQPVRTLEGHSGGVVGVAVSGDGRRAVSASADKTLKVWDLDSGQPVRTLEGHSGWVLGVAVSGDGRRAVSASADKTLKVWDLDQFLCIATFTCEGGAHCCSFVSPTKVVAGDAGGRLYFLELVLEPKELNLIEAIQATPHHPQQARRN